MTEKIQEITTQEQQMKALNDAMQVGHLKDAKRLAKMIGEDSEKVLFEGYASHINWWKNDGVSLSLIQNLGDEGWEYTIQAIELFIKYDRPDLAEKIVGLETISDEAVEEIYKRLGKERKIKASNYNKSFI